MISRFYMAHQIPHMAAVQGEEAYCQASVPLFSFRSQGSFHKAYAPPSRDHRCTASACRPRCPALCLLPHRGNVLEHPSSRRSRLEDSKCTNRTSDRHALRHVRSSMLGRNVSRRILRICKRFLHTKHHSSRCRRSSI
mgnify:CR=1 FL=1